MGTKPKNGGSKKKKCGIVMPISAINECSQDHWAEVLAILKSAVEDNTDFEPNLVSDSDDVGIIQKRIVQNLYSNEIVVCDVSCKNPNVMFEMGMRLAFDKPTIIIKDDKTDYTFDTSIIEHLTYPRDLRFSKIVEFKETFAAKIEATYDKSVSNAEHSTFLKSFGDYRVAEIQEKEVSSEEFLVNALGEIRSDIQGFKSEVQGLKMQQMQMDSESRARRGGGPNRVVTQQLLRFLFERSMPVNALRVAAVRREAFSYIEQSAEVRMACGSLGVIKKIFNNILSSFLGESFTIEKLGTG